MCPLRTDLNAGDYHKICCHFCPGITFKACPRSSLIPSGAVFSLRGQKGFILCDPLDLKRGKSDLREFS